MPETEPTSVGEEQSASAGDVYFSQGSDGQETILQDPGQTPDRGQLDGSRFPAIRSRLSDWQAYWRDQAEGGSLPPPQPIGFGSAPSAPHHVEQLTLGTLGLDVGPIRRATRIFSAEVGRRRRPTGST